jgi:hypothetical protein
LTDNEWERGGLIGLGRLWKVWIIAVRSAKWDGQTWKTYWLCWHCISTKNKFGCLHNEPKMEWIVRRDLAITIHHCHDEIRLLYIKFSPHPHSTPHLTS